MPDPTARPVGWWDTIWGNPTRFAQQPHSQGALLGAGYQGMPTSARIADVRHEAPDYPYQINHPGPDSGFDPKIYPTSFETNADLTKVPNIYPPSDTGTMALGWRDLGAYNPSFQQNMRPRATRIPLGPPLPAPFTGNLPFPITPGDPGWTTPPSVSGPHNRQGDPDRPGYSREIYWNLNAAQPQPGITLNSLPPDQQAGF